MEELLSLISLAFDKGALKQLVFSRPKDGALPVKVKGRMAMRRSHPILALEFTEKGDTVSQKNVTREELTEVLAPLIGSYRQVNLITHEGDAEYKVKKDGDAVLLGGEKLSRRLSRASLTPDEAIGALDRKKNYILTGAEPFLIALGVSDKDGRVHDKKQAKFRQINRFLEILSDASSRLPKEGKVCVYDLCSGKSYLSFAVYHYLTAVLGREVDMLCIDLKEDVVRSCAALAERIGFSGMRFLAEDIRKAPTDARVDLVISLHACDVATDIVLETAAKLRAGVILSTPCCHRELSRHLDCAPLAFVTKYGKLRDKLAEALTDGLRLIRLESEGYKVAALELTDPDDTPKNTLLLAYLIGEKNEKKRKEYEDTLSYLLGEKRSEYPF